VTRDSVLFRVTVLVLFFVVLVHVFPVTEAGSGIVMRLDDSKVCISNGTPGVLCWQVDADYRR
jgi:hypothetical protein